jgi:hypothetical protein
MRDLPSAVFAWVAAAAGVAVAVVAALYPHESPKTPAALLAVAAVVTVQLFAFAATCYTSRFWLATQAASPAADPRQLEPKIRRGIPALKSNQSAAWGFDAWSLVVVLLAVLPVAVPLLSLYRPSGYMRPNAPLGPVNPTGLTHNADGVGYTTSSYEAVDLAVHSRVDKNTQGIVVRNSADVYIMQKSSRVAVPSRVPQACMHDEVRAKNLRAVFGKYECMYSTKPPKGVRELNPDTPDRVDLSVWTPLNTTNTTLPLGRAQWNITVAFEKKPLKVNCGVTYQIAYPVQVVWRGKNGTYARFCQIASVNYNNAKFYDFNDDTRSTFTGLWEKDMTQLELAFKNAFVHAIEVGTSGDTDNFIGAIFAASAFFACMHGCIQVLLTLAAPCTHTLLCLAAPCHRVVLRQGVTWAQHRLGRWRADDAHGCPQNARCPQLGASLHHLATAHSVRRPSCCSSCFSACQPPVQAKVHTLP